MASDLDRWAQHEGLRHWARLGARTVATFAPHGATYEEALANTAALVLVAGIEHPEWAAGVSVDLELEAVIADDTLADRRAYTLAVLAGAPTAYVHPSAALLQVLAACVHDSAWAIERYAELRDADAAGRRLPAQRLTWAQMRELAADIPRLLPVAVVSPRQGAER